MDLLNLSVQYRNSGEKIRVRVRQLQEEVNKPMSETERLALRRRIVILSSMARETIATSNYLQHYYEEEHKQ
ncbi:MAG: hypothetical protein ACOX7K_10030 [Oscillospiraceae bacterium]